MFFTLLGNPDATSGTTVDLTVSNDARNFDLWAWIESELGGVETTYSIFNVTIDSGVIIGSNSTGTPAFTTGSFPAGSVLTIVNNGTIVGRGGNGGAWGSATVATNGDDGGDAMIFTLDATLTNNNLIGGGGGGGASGIIYAPPLGFYSDGGGGAGDAVGEAGSTGGDAYDGLLRYGGSGSSTDSGDGGNLGAAGGNGTAGGTGGSAGLAIDKDSNTVTVTNNGTISGTIQA